MESCEDVRVNFFIQIDIAEKVATFSFWFAGTLSTSFEFSL